MREENSNSQSVNYTITSCQRGTTQGVYKVLFGDGSSFFLSIDFFLKKGLKKGLVIDETLYQQLKNESSFIEVFQKAISLLQRQQYTATNLKRKLLTKDFETTYVDQCIEYLKDSGRLDDCKFAYSWVQSRIRTKKDSYKKLYAGLMNKGISSSIAKDVLGELYTFEVLERNLYYLIEKLQGQNRESDVIIKKLINKGFNIRDIKRCLSESS